MKYLWLLIFSFCIANNCHAESSDSLSYKRVLGFTGRLSQQNNFSADVYFGFPFLNKENLLELNIGYTYFKNQTNFDGVDDLLISSHGIYIEGNYFFTTKLYTGLRLILSGNWVDEESQERYDAVRTKDPPNYFSALAWLGNLGFNQPLGSRVSLKIQTQLGVHNYKIATGNLYFSNSDNPITSTFTEEKKQSFYII